MYEQCILYNIYINFKEGDSFIYFITMICNFIILLRYINVYSTAPVHVHVHVYYMYMHETTCSLSQ